MFIDSIMGVYQTHTLILDKSVKIGLFDIYLQLSFICIMLSVGIFYNVLNVSINNANTIVGCVGDLRGNHPCIYSAWAPLPHHGNVYNTSSKSYSSNSNILSSHNCIELEEICSIVDSSGSHVPLHSDGNSKVYCSDLDPYVSLKSIRTSNINRQIVGQLIIYSLENKVESVTHLVKHIDILVLTETKLDETFPKNQYLIDGYSLPFRQDRNKNGGGGGVEL